MGVNCGDYVPLARVYIIDNLDSFTYNIAHGLVAAGAVVDVCLAHKVNLDSLEINSPDLIVISPGPGSPVDARVSLSVIERFAGRIPIFGVCLGMQCMAVAFGGVVGPGCEPVHGKTSDIVHDGQGIFAGLPEIIRVGRYHSLHVTEVPSCMKVTARCMNGVPMAMRHRYMRMIGVQFHPDSFLTEDGPAILKHVIQGNF
jgi:anthranilate synthase/aminodeoxychorismate synthase-like glutamine amidotransferase